MKRPNFDQMTDKEILQLGDWINHRLGAENRKQVQKARMKAELGQEQESDIEPEQERELKCLKCL